VPFLLKTCAWTARFAVKALPLRSDERENHAALTARTATRLAPPGRAFAFNAPLQRLETIAALAVRHRETVLRLTVEWEVRQHPVH